MYVIASMSQLMGSLRSLCSGLLLLPVRPSASDASRLLAACSAINHRLFIDLIDNTGSLFQIMSPRELSDRLQQLYSEAFAFAPHLDVRILLPPLPGASPPNAQLHPEMPHNRLTSMSDHMNRGYGSHISVCVPLRRCWSAHLALTLVQVPRWAGHGRGQSVQCSSAASQRRRLAAASAPAVILVLRAAVGARRRRQCCRCCRLSHHCCCRLKPVAVGQLQTRGSRWHVRSSSPRA